VALPAFRYVYSNSRSIKTCLLLSESYETSVWQHGACNELSHPPRASYRTPTPFRYQKRHICPGKGAAAIKNGLQIE